MNYFRKTSIPSGSTNDLLGLEAAKDFGKVDNTRKNVESSVKLPTYDDVLLAEKALKGRIHRTRILTSETLDDQLTQLAHEHQDLGPEYTDKKVQLFMKCENEQKAGSFKIRGAFNTLSRFTEEQRKQGVLAYSAGNHAQGVALSSKILGMKATIIMPKDSPALKVDATRGYGADIIFVDRFKEDIDAFVKSKQKETGRTFVSPFDNFHVIAGQGTVGKEILEDVPNLDHIVVCIGGGGLISGISLAVNAINPKCRVHGVEPQGGNDAEQSLLTGQIVDIPGQKTIAEGAALPHIGVHNLPIMCKHVERIVNVKDEALIECMKFFGERCKVVVEPTGCLGLAGVQKLITQGIIKPGDRVACLISGGNIDMTRYTNLLMYGTDDKAAIRECQEFKIREELRSGLAISNDSTSAETPFRKYEMDDSSEDELINSPQKEIDADLSIIPEVESYEVAEPKAAIVQDDWHGWSYVNSLSKQDRWSLSTSKTQLSLFGKVCQMLGTH